MIQSVMLNFSRLVISNSCSVLPKSVNFSANLSKVLTPYDNQIRFICKDRFKNEPGWKAFGYRWMVKFPETYTIKKLPLVKLAGRDPTTGNGI